MAEGLTGDMTGGGENASRGPRLFADPERRLAWFRAAVCLSFIGGLFITRRLWLSSRFLPQTPVFPHFPATPFPLDVALLAALCALLAWTAFSKRYAHTAVGAFAIAAFLVMQDQARLFPSIYEFCFVLLLLAAYAFSRAKDPEVPLRTARLILIAIYVWSGIQKLNPAFAQAVFPELVRPAMPYLSAHPALLVLLAGASPLFEIGLGLGLLTKTYRSKALVAALAMHAFLFVTIGPFWNPWEKAAWAWSLATAFLVFILFFQAEDTDWKGLLFQKGRMHVAAAVLFAMLPIMNMFGLLDSALAFNVFSGNFTRGTFYLSEMLVARLPDEARTYVVRDGGGRAVFDVRGLSFAETTAGLYAETRIYLQIERKLCLYATQPGDSILILQERTNWLGAPPPKVIDCAFR